MLVLFSLAIHNALAEVKAQLVEGEFLFASSVDVYVVAQPARITFICNLWGTRFHEEQGSSWTEAKLERGTVEECAQRRCRS